MEEAPYFNGSNILMRLLESVSLTGDQYTDLMSLLYFGSTAILVAMDVLPKFKSETGVQKVNTIFLTDGESSAINSYVDIPTTEHDDREYRYNRLERRNDMIVTDPVTGKKLRHKSYRNYYDYNDYDQHRRRH